jgi:hypothetical protein
MFAMNEAKAGYCLKLLNVLMVWLRKYSNQYTIGKEQLAMDNGHGQWSKKKYNITKVKC